MAESTLRLKIEADSKQAVQDTDKFAMSVDNLNSSSDDLSKTLVKNTNIIGKFAQSIRNIAIVSNKALSFLNNGLVQVGSSFQNMMTDIAAIGGLDLKTKQGKKQFLILEKAAEDLGSKTLFAASQVAEGIKNTITAGFAPLEAAKSIPSILNLGIIGKTDLGSAASAVVGQVRGFNLAVSESNKVVNFYAKAMTTADVLFNDLRESVKLTTPTFSEYGLSMKSMFAILGKLGDLQIKGSVSGTALNGAIRALVAPTSEAKDTMEDLGFSIVNGVGEMKQLPVLFKDLQKSLRGYSAIEKAEVLNKIFEKASLGVVSAILNMSEASADGVTDLQKYTDSFDESNKGLGLAADISKKMADDLDGDIKALSSSIEALQIVVFKGFSPFLRAFTQGLTEFVRIITGLLKTTQMIAREFAKNFRNAIAPALKELQPIIDFVEPLIGWLGKFFAVLKDGGGELSGISGAIAKLGTQFGILVSSTIQLFTSLSNSIRLAGPEFMLAFSAGLYKAGEMAYNAVFYILTQIRSLFPFSEPKNSNSPLYGFKESGIAFINNFIIGIQIGIKSSIPYLKKAFNSLLARILLSGFLSKIISLLPNIISGLNNKIIQLSSAPILSLVTSLLQAIPLVIVTIFKTISQSVSYLVPFITLLTHLSQLILTILSSWRTVIKGFLVLVVVFGLLQGVTEELEAMNSEVKKSSTALSLIIKTLIKVINFFGKVGGFIVKVVDEILVVGKSIVGFLIDSSAGMRVVIVAMFALMAFVISKTLKYLIRQFVIIFSWLPNFGAETANGIQKQTKVMAASFAKLSLTVKALARSMCDKFGGCLSDIGERSTLMWSGFVEKSRTAANKTTGFFRSSWDKVTSFLSSSNMSFLKGSEKRSAIMTRSHILARQTRTEDPSTPYAQALSAGQKQAHQEARDSTNKAQEHVKKSTDFMTVHWLLFSAAVIKIWNFTTKKIAAITATSNKRILALYHAFGVALKGINMASAATWKLLNIAVKAFHSTILVHITLVNLAAVAMKLWKGTVIAFTLTIKVLTIAFVALRLGLRMFATVSPLSAFLLIGAALIALIANIEGFGAVMFKAGKGLIMGLWNGIKSMAGFLYDNFWSFLKSAIRMLLPFSDAEEGPLSDLTESGKAIPGTLGAGIEAGGDIMTRAMNFVLNSTYEEMVAGIKKMGKYAVRKMKEIYKTIYEWYKGDAPAISEAISREDLKKYVDTGIFGIKKLKQMVTDLANHRIKEARFATNILKQQLTESQKAYKKYAEKAKEFEKSIVDEKRRQGLEIIELNRGALVDYEKEYDIREELEQTDRKIKKLLEEKKFEEAEQVARQRENAARQLLQLKISQGQREFEEDKKLAEKRGRLQEFMDWSEPLGGKEFYTQRAEAMDEVKKSFELINEAMAGAGEAAKTEKNKIKELSEQLAKIREQTKALSNVKLALDFDIKDPTEAMNKIMEAVRQIEDTGIILDIKPILNSELIKAQAVGGDIKREEKIKKQQDELRKLNEQAIILGDNLTTAGNFELKLDDAAALKKLKNIEAILQKISQTDFLAKTGFGFTPAKASGGKLPGFASGGKLPGFSFTDNILAKFQQGGQVALAGGEYIVNALRTKKLEPLLDFLNFAPLPEIKKAFEMPNFPINQNFAQNTNIGMSNQGAPTIRRHIFNLGNKEYPVDGASEQLEKLASAIAEELQR